jgi:hypothetical protein
MIATKGDITNMKRRPIFMKERSMASWKDLNFDTHYKNPNFSRIQLATTIIRSHDYDKQGHGGKC